MTQTRHKMNLIPMGQDMMDPSIDRGLIFQSVYIGVRVQDLNLIFFSHVQTRSMHRIYEVLYIWISS